MVDEQGQADERFRNLQNRGGAFRERVTSSVKATGKKLVPNAIIKEVQTYRTYTDSERPIYLKIRLLNSLGLANPKSLRPLETARSYVFVCFGNIMRSPMCEALMHRALASIPKAQITVTSAGLNAVPGRAPHPWAVKGAQEFGISLENHRARLLTPEMVSQADVIFAMDCQNQVQLRARYSHAKNKVFMLSAYAGEDYRSFEIRDPYYAGEEGTRSCYKVLNTCVQNLVRSLFGN